MDSDTLGNQARAEQLAGMRRRGVLRAGETVSDAVDRALATLLSVDAELTGAPDRSFADAVTELVADGVLVFSTAPLANTGAQDAVTASCTVLPLPQHGSALDLPGIQAASATALTEAIGTGYDLSASPDPCSALASINEMLAVIDQNLLAANRRPVASMATLRADHPRIIEFVRAKRSADFAGWRVTQSVLTDEKLFRAADSGQPYDLVDSTGGVVHSIDARLLLHEIADSSHCCGEPGIMFWDRFERDNPTPQWRYLSSAPCAEVAMPVGDACHFSYVNLARLAGSGQFDLDRFGTAVRLLTRVLDASVELTTRNGHRIGLTLVGMKRRIGVGLTGFADLLVELRLPYGHAESVRLAGEISEAVDYHSKVESVRLARARGPFPAYLTSRYTDREWVRRKLDRSGSRVVSSTEWGRLHADMLRHGIRHACTTALPSAETSSALVDASTSLEPLLSLTGPDGRVRPPQRQALERAWGAVRLASWEANLRPGQLAALPDTELARLPHLRTAYQVGYDDHLRVQAAFQSFMDDGISKTINVPQDTTPAEFYDAFQLAYQLNLKGTSLFRAGCLEERR